MELWDIYDSNREKTGRTHERGKPIPEGDYHIVVYIWIQNSDGKYLITKRTPNKPWPNMWECTGGSAVVGDTSLEAALREVVEETGLTLEPTKGEVIDSIKRENDFCDVWFFTQDFDISEVVFQKDETCDAKWVTEAEIRFMIKAGEFFCGFYYIEDVFDYGRRID